MTDQILSRKRPQSPVPQPSIHQSGDNASVTVHGPYNDVRGDQNTYITHLGGKLRLVQYP